MPITNAVRVLAANPGHIVADTAGITILADGSVWHLGELVTPPRRLQGVPELRRALLVIHATWAGVDPQALIDLASPEA